MRHFCFVAPGPAETLPIWLMPEWNSWRGDARPETNQIKTGQRVAAQRPEENLVYRYRSFLNAIKLPESSRYGKVTAFTFFEMEMQ
ncbi:MAG: hypothetical protein HQK60_02140 [Deltaproteobacteria bacterium]|nr:hypothetical protein [Deltaproteobacteria bacterium]